MPEQHTFNKNMEIDELGNPNGEMVRQQVEYNRRLLGINDKEIAAHWAARDAALKRFLDWNAGSATDIEEKAIEIGVEAGWNARSEENAELKKRIAEMECDIDRLQKALQMRVVVAAAMGNETAQELLTEMEKRAEEPKK